MAQTPRLGERMTPQELESADLDVAEGFVGVWGETNDGTPAPRLLRKNQLTVLIGDLGAFQTSGPTASLCNDCGELLYTEQACAFLVHEQRHYSSKHGYTPPLLP